MEDNNKAVDELINYIHQESPRSLPSNNAAVSAHRETMIRYHAIAQLIEAKFGADVSAAAAATTTEGGSCPSSSSARGDKSVQDDDNDDLSLVARELMESTSFCQMRDALRNHQMSFTESSSSTTTTTGDGHEMNSKKAKKFSDDTVAAAPSPAPLTSFSLFALLDAQGGGGGSGSVSFPPRIMARQIIDTFQRENNHDSPSDELTTLELFEKAEDVEDLSPDSESWEEIRTILFVGLSSSSSCSSKSNAGIDETARYLRVHENLFEKCRGNDTLKVQLWGLAQNIVGTVLAQCAHFGDASSTVLVSKQTLDYCWDTIHSLLNVLSHLAVDYVISSVGNELEIERMFLGLCMMLSNNFAACILGMMEPMAGYFEVWARFVHPDRFIAIIHASGLGGAILRRCESLGKRAAIKIIWNTIQPTDATSLDDIEHCNYLQSLSILRTILFRCDGSPQIMSLIHQQFSATNNSDSSNDCILSSFLGDQGIASPRDVQALITQAEEQCKLQWNQMKHIGNDDEIQSALLKPFQGVLQVNETIDGVVDSKLQLLCSQTIDMVSR